jgi:transcriptional regulator with XRE-family HTH domain
LSTTIDTRCLNIVLLLTFRAASWSNAAEPRRTTSARDDVDQAAWKTFGEWIEQRREHAGLTVGELAERAGVSRVWLQVLRKGGRRIEGEWRQPNPKSAALARVARALDVPVEEMFARAGREVGTSTTGPDDQEASPPDGIGTEAVERIRELEERVARTELEMAELRQLLERQRAERANVR